MGAAMEFGQIAGLVAAVCWATGSFIYSRLDAPAAALNLAKNAISGTLLVASIPLFGSGLAPWIAAPGTVYLWLIISAVVGIQIGDAAYFRSIQILGPRKALVLTTLTPPFSALLGWFWLAEQLSRTSLIAMAITLAGIAVVIRDRNLASDRSGLHQGDARDGLLLGIFAAFCQSTGLALSKVAMEYLPPLEASAIRIVAAFVGGFIVAQATGVLPRWMPQLRAPGVPQRLLVASFIGTYIGIWLSLVSANTVDLAVATTQMSTTPVFMVLLVAIFLRKKISLVAFIGMAIAIVGVALLMRPDGLPGG